MKDDRFNTIRNMILIRVLLVPFLIVLAVCGTVIYHFAQYSIQQVNGKLVRVTSDHLILINQFLEERVAELAFIATSFGIDELKNKERLTRIFYNLQAGSKAFADIGLFDETGRHIAYVGPYDLAGRDYGRTDWFKAVQEKGLFISDEFMGFRNIPHFIIAIRRNEGDRAWYLRATIDTFKFNDLVENILIGKTGEAYLVNKNGVFQSRRRSGGRLMEPDLDFGSYLIDPKRITSFSIDRGADQSHVYAAGMLKNTGWILVVRQAAADAYSAQNSAVTISVIMIIGGGIIVLAMGFVQASGMANRLRLADMEKQQMKTQLVIAGKLAEVGEMSAGVAHEINNPLQVMQAELSMIKEIISDIHSDDNVCNPENFGLLKDSAEQIGIQIARCGKITQGLLRFARKSEASIQRIEMHKFMPELVDMVEKRATLENIRIVQELSPDIPAIMSDANQLQQVFLNLLNNAIYALKNRPSPEIRIKSLQENENVIVTVSDNGCGISPENMEKIFLPFYTTKPVGQGTGLGLSTVYGIVDGLGGKITVESELNAGTLFNISLPINPPNSH